MKYVGKILYVTFVEMVACGIYQQTILTAKYRGSRGWEFIKDPQDSRCLLIRYDVLADKYKHALTVKYIDVHNYAVNMPILELVKRDLIAEQFYLDYEVNGKQLTSEQVAKYSTACDWLNMIKMVRADKNIVKNLGVSINSFYSAVVELIRIKDIDLPTSYARLMDKVAKYEKEGYEALVSAKIGNKNRAKIMDNLSKSMLLEMIAHPNNYDDVFVASQYNLWAVANNYEKISKSTVKNYRKTHEKEIVMQRDGNAALNAKYIKQVKGTRPAWPLLMVESDDNHLDLYFYDVPTKNPYVRYKGIFVVDSYNDYVLGYAVSTVLDTSLVYKAYTNAMRHIYDITGVYYVPNEIKTDKWAIKELKPFYESFAKYMDTPVGSKHRGYIEQFFGSAHWKRCIKAGATNYTGNNITAKNRGVNLEYVVANKNNYPTTGAEAEKQIADFVERLRHMVVEGVGMSKQTHWLNALAEMPAELKNSISKEMYLQKFGMKHPKELQVTNRGIEFSIKNKKFSFDCEVDELSDVIGLKVDVYYDLQDMSTLLAVSERVRFVATNAQYHTRTMAESSEGSRKALNAVFEQKKRTVERLAKAAEDRKNTLKTAQMSAEDALMQLSVPKALKQEATDIILLNQAGVFTKTEQSDDDFYKQLIDDM